jgi:hypothetical protein
MAAIVDETTDERVRGVTRAQRLGSRAKCGDGTGGGIIQDWEIVVLLE